MKCIKKDKLCWVLLQKYILWQAKPSTVRTINVMKCDDVQLLFCYFHLSRHDLWSSTVTSSQKLKTTISIPRFFLTLVIYECREHTWRCWELADDNEGGPSFIEPDLYHKCVIVCRRFKDVSFHYWHLTLYKKIRFTNHIQKTHKMKWQHSTNGQKIKTGVRFKT